jgi:hypothetical protein
VANQPQIVGSEAAMPRGAIEQLLRTMPPATILVGGQALAFWMSRYGLVRTDGADYAVTRDADLIGSLADAKRLAQSLHGHLVVPRKNVRSSIVAQVRLPVSGSALEYNIDVLHQLYDVGGLRKSSEFTRRAVARAAIISIPGDGEIRILHPMDVLASRVNNAAGLLKDKGEHVLTQVRWAIEVARHALVRVAQHPTGEERPRNLAQEIYRLACSSAGRRLVTEHGIDVFDAMPINELLRLDPDFESQAAAMRRALAAQRSKRGPRNVMPSAAKKN